MGFIDFFRQFGAQSKSLFDFLWSLPMAYTIRGADLPRLALASRYVPLRWGNVFTTLLIPQRSMLFGLPFVAMIIALWWMAFDKKQDGGIEGQRDEETERQGHGKTGTQKDRKTKRHGESERPSSDSSLRPSVPLSLRRRYMLAAGVLAGLLPMLHSHGFFSIMLASAPMFLLFRSKEWLAFFVPVAVLAAPQAWYLSGTQVRNALFKPLPNWWEAGDSNPLLFWAANAGIFILILIAALLIRKIVSSRQALFYLPFTLWFFLPNLVSLAPWTWDNIKVLVYWSLASAPFVAAALAYLFTRRSIIANSLAAALLIGLIFSGALDVMRALSPVENVGIFDKPKIEVAALLREKTPPRAVILHAPIHNSVIALSGRQSVMGYPGHLWTHGLNYAQRELDVKAIYKGGAQMIEPLSRLGVDYVIVGPEERAALGANDSYFGYPVVIDHAGYRVYQVKRTED
jgi:hypothetical protein